MECPQCGYVMGPFETECPRCARLTVQGKSPTPAGQPPAPPEKTIAKQTAELARNTVRSMKPEPLFHLDVDTPDLGWPLTIVLWISLVFHVGVLILFIVYQAYTNIGIISMVSILTWISALIGLIGLLRCQRWAFRLYIFSAVLPALMSLMLGGGANILAPLLDIVPALLIFVLVLTKWDEFE